ncbi:hypothetical protein EDD28_2641 [Salana multivorans]|uniref:Uncharacterized protein n=1 Tax=Salana multivorans TaxID=120377 RepID=A0A3N2D0G2_9MICO|nr:hypothetical protein [Salana multivorans]MBN8880871.1 hypothetical protein [Salana multivorans]OJX94669.1 MAG: hypothetical protein BGO96_00910 [Micrococcales bacterium 73-15]ROR93233.1 hypothetical protein EDD28_2641 [Salana multivorans]
MLDAVGDGVGFVSGPPVGRFAGPPGVVPVSATRAVSDALSMFPRGVGTLCGLVAVVWVALAALSLPLRLLTGDPGFLANGAVLLGTWSGWRTYLVGAAAMLLSGLVTGVLTLLLARGALRVVRTGALRFADCWSLPRGWFGYAGVIAVLTLLPALAPASSTSPVSVSSAVALVCLVASLGLAFAPFALSDDPGRAGAAIGASLRLVRENLGQTLLLALLCLVVLALGALACFVGLVVAIPVAVTAYARLYVAIRGEEVVIV